MLHRSGTLIFRTTLAFALVGSVIAAVWMANNSVEQATAQQPPSNQTAIPQTRIEQSQEQPIADKGFAKIAQPFFTAYCMECHGEDAEGDFEIAADLSNNFSNRATLGKWSEVVNALNSHEMPPKSSPQPAARETAELVDWITQQMVAAAKRSRANRVVLRRLNRNEYRNTIRDLVGIEFDTSAFPQDSSAGGFDNNGSALTLSPLQLELYYDAARTILDRALVTGPQPETIKWRFEHENASGDYNWQDFGDQRIIIHGAQNRKQGGYTILHHDAWDRRPDAREFHVPHEGVYTIRIRAASQVPNRNEVIRTADIFLNQRRNQRMMEIPEGDYATKEYDKSTAHFETDPIYEYGNPRLDVTVTLNGAPYNFPALEIDAPLNQPQDYELQYRFTRQNAGVLLKYAYDVPKVLENFWFQHEDQFARPEIWVDWTELEGPIFESWPPPSHTRIISDPIPGSLSEQRELAKKIIKRFASSAFRRPVTDAEIESKLLLFDSELAARMDQDDLPATKSDSDDPSSGSSSDPNVIQGELRLPSEIDDLDNPGEWFNSDEVNPDESKKTDPKNEAMLLRETNFIQSIKSPLTAVLISPDFLYLAEPVSQNDGTNESSGPQPTTTERTTRLLNNYELASRLSYFLTSSMPDDELIRLAGLEKLTDSTILSQQVDRLLAIDDAAAFTENFAGQWLGLRSVGANPPTAELFPRYDRHLELSIVKESESFFAEILNNDLACSNFISSDFVVINQRLARFYGIPDVQGDHFRRVAVPDGVHRGGVVTQASVLTITSNGTRTSPVKRGTWVLKNVLGMDPGLPVANAGEIAPKVPGIDKATVRKRLEIHRELAQCARCHNKIDPLGFALENFDASGRWREKEGFGYQGRPNEDDPDIDASAVLPDGTEIDGVDSLRDQMLKNKSQFYRCLAEKMFIYGLGRELTIIDQPEIENAVQSMMDNDETLRSLIKYIVTSKPFLAK